MGQTGHWIQRKTDVRVPSSATALATKDLLAGSGSLLFQGGQKTVASALFLCLNISILSYLQAGTLG